MEAFEAEFIKFGGTAIIRPVVAGCRRSVVVALLGLGLAFGMATEAAAQTCATTDVAITGVTPAPSDPAALAGDCATPARFSRTSDTCQGNPRTTSDARMGLRQRLLDPIDQSGLSDREISLRAIGNPNAVRNLRRGATPRLDTVEALCRVLGQRLVLVPLDDRRHLPVWSHLLDQEIRRDFVKILGRFFPRRYPG